MIKIKDYIFNEYKILEIKENDQENELIVYYDTNNHDRVLRYIKNATLEDIEWNCGTQQETQRQMQKELCKSCYYRDTISNKLKELEEKNNTFEDYNKNLNNQIDKLEEDLEVEKSTTSNLAQRILKAIKKLENMKNIKGGINSTILQAINEVDNTIKILKGEENE